MGKGIGKEINIIIKKDLDKKNIIYLYIAEIFLCVTLYIQSFILSKFIDDLLIKHKSSLFLNYAVCFFICLVCYIAFESLSKIKKKLIENEYREIIYRKILDKSFRICDVIDLELLRGIFEIDLPKLIEVNVTLDIKLKINMVFAILGIAILFIISPLLSFIIIIILIFSYLVDVYLLKKLNILNEKMRQEDQIIADFMINSLDEWEEIKNHNLTNVFEELYDKLIQSYISFMNKWVIVWENRNIYMDFKRNILQYVLVYIVGGLLIKLGGLRLDVLIMYGQIFTVVYDFLDNMLNNYYNFVEVDVHRKSVINYLNRSESNSKITIRDGDIMVDNITFSYDDNSPKLYQDFTCNFEKKKINIIVGENGIGKTTLCKIITNVISPAKGTVLIDGVPIRRENTFCGTNSISMYSKNVSFLQFSLKDALLPYKEKNMDVILEYLQLSNRISELKDGINTKIMDDDIFSGGEKQRLFIIRTVLSGAKVLIFDEPTSALDDDNTERFKNILNVVKKDCTIILVTHDRRLTAIGENIINLES